MSLVDFTADSFSKEQDMLSSMGLVDLLWDQDVDMGVTRELYDPKWRQQQEKEQQLQLQKMEKLKKQLAQQESMRYTIDEETGERIPVLNTPAKPASFESQISKDSLSTELEALSELMAFDDMDMEKYLNHHFPQQESANRNPWPTLDDLQYPSLMPAGRQENQFTPDSVNNTNSTPSTSQYTDLNSMYTNNNLPAPAPAPASSNPAPSNLMSDLEEFMDVGHDYQSYYNNEPDDNMEDDMKPFIFSDTPGQFVCNLDGASGGAQANSPSFSQCNQSSSGDSNSFNDGSSSSGESNKDDKSKRNSSRDEQRCRDLKIPFTVDTITNCPVDEFNSMMRQHEFTEEQLTLIKDIRRRGKNKVAAQNCRKKKLFELTGLEDEIGDLKRKRTALVRDKAVLEKNMADLEAQMNQTYAEVFASLTDARGQPFDPRFYRLDITADGEPHIVLNNIPALTQPQPLDYRLCGAYAGLLDLSMKV